MKGGEFIAFARKLRTFPAAQCPAGYRSITSRLYYGAYHEALDFIETDLGFPHRKTDDIANKHQFIVEYLTGSQVQQAQDLAAQLGQMHERRKNADYDIAKARFDGETFAVESVVRLDRILMAIDACREDSVRIRIENGMSTYRQRRSARPPGSSSR
jgi:hypothetical protein